MLQVQVDLDGPKLQAYGLSAQDVVNVIAQQNIVTPVGDGATLSVPALTGAIMCMGVATANSILVVSFARERLAEGDDPLTAAMAAGFTRFRPVLMTALAMIIGMAPMALSAEQNAPLGRAVIGGLVFATIATLLFVPALFRLVHEHRERKVDAPTVSLEAKPA